MVKNKATKHVGIVRICDIVTKKPVFTYKKANVTGFNLAGENSYAKIGGENAIPFSEPLSGTLKIEGQVIPFELYSLISNGIVKSEAVITEQKIIKCETAGTLTLETGVVLGSVYVFAEGDIGGTDIKGTVTGSSFTATQPSDIAVGNKYEVCYMVTKTSGIRKIEFSDSALPKAYYIEILTYQKDEDEVVTPYRVIAYKAMPKRALDMTFQSDGDPATTSFEFELMKDKNGKFSDMIEWTEADPLV